MTSPLTAEEFDGLMAALGMTSSSGRIAVACSGGADSMALAVLAAEWGQVVALTVDHGLREDSAAESRQVSAWMESRGIEHHILVAHDLNTGSDLQARRRSSYSS